MDGLYDWASKRADWQQVALRRLTECRTLSDEDLNEFQAWIEKKYGLPTSVPVSLHPLQKDDLRRGVAEDPTTILGSIGPVKNVDRLAPDQRPLQFAIDGITLVYGPNGSGKSGYCRIAKSLCRSLHEATLRGNVFESGKNNAPEVNVTFRIGSEKDKCEITWRTPEPSPPELARISVFDAHVAGLYVDGDRNIEFLPYELDLLNRFALGILTLEERFRVRESSLKLAANTSLTIGYNQGSEVFITLAKLVPGTSLEQLPTEKCFRDLATWTSENKQRLQILSDELRNDPGALAEARRRMKSTIETLAKEVDLISRTLNDESVEDLSAKYRDATSKRKVAQASAQDLFKEVDCAP